MDKVDRTDAEWREQLTPEEYAVYARLPPKPRLPARHRQQDRGRLPLPCVRRRAVRLDAKFESHGGWPSFYQPSDSDAVVLIEDRTLGVTRTEVRCAACDSHLGHVFTGEGYEVPTDQRWCINSVSLHLEPGYRPRREPAADPAAIPLSGDTAQTGGMIRTAAISGELVGARALWMGQRPWCCPGPLPATITTATPKRLSTWPRAPGLRVPRPDSGSVVRLETEPGDYVWVPPHVPHREENPSPDTEAVVVIARSTQEAIVVNVPEL